MVMGAFFACRQKLLGLAVRSFLSLLLEAFLACCYEACFLVLGFKYFLACKFINNYFLVICQAVVLFAFLLANVYMMFAQCVFGF